MKVPDVLLLPALMVATVLAVGLVVGLVELALHVTFHLTDADIAKSWGAICGAFVVGIGLGFWFGTRSASTKAVRGDAGSGYDPPDNN